MHGSFGIGENHRVALALAVIAIVAAARPRAARACTCSPEPFVASPANQALDVPINAAVVIKYRGYYAPQIKVTINETASSTTVPATSDVHWDWQVERPTSTLKPDTEYTIEVRWLAMDVALETTTFTTGTRTDESSLAFDGLTAFTPETMSYPILATDGQFHIDSCVSATEGHISRSRVAFPTPPADAVLLAFSVVRESDGMLVGDTFIAPDATTVGYLTCAALSPNFEAGERYCANVTAIGAAGQNSGQSAQLCSAVIECIPKLSADDEHPVDSCDTDEQPPDDGGCAASGAGKGTPWMLALAIAFLCQRRKLRART